MLDVRDPDLVAIANEGEQMFGRDASNTPYSDDYRFVAAAGEKALAEFCGRPMNKPGHDGGRDNILTLEIGGDLIDYRVQVKAAKKPFNLIVWPYEVARARIFFQALFHEPTQDASLIGWQWDTAVGAAPIKPTFRGNLKHHVPMCRLRPMRELEARVRRP